MGFRTGMRLNGNWGTVQSIIFIVEFILPCASGAFLTLTGNVYKYKYEKKAFQETTAAMMAIFRKSLVESIIEQDNNNKISDLRKNYSGEV